jgi:hypothetical protein
VANIEKMNQAAEKLARANQDVAQTVVEHTIGLGERNVRFAQGVVDNSVKEIRQQAESNRALTQEFVERAENQRAAFQTVVEESVDAYLDFVFAPLSYYKEGLQAAKKVTA